MVKNSTAPLLLDTVKDRPYAFSHQEWALPGRLKLRALSSLSGAIADVDKISCLVGSLLGPQEFSFHLFGALPQIPSRFQSFFHQVVFQVGLDMDVDFIQDEFIGGQM